MIIIIIIMIVLTYQVLWQYVVVQQCSYHSVLEISHYDAQSSPIGQYIVIYFFLSYIIYAHLVDRISILLLIVGQQTRYSLFLVLRISCILRTVLIINLCQCLLLVSVFIFCPLLLPTSSPGCGYFISACSYNLSTFRSRQVLSQVSSQAQGYYTIPYASTTRLDSTPPRSLC